MTSRTLRALAILAIASSGSAYASVSGAAAGAAVAAPHVADTTFGFDRPTAIAAAGGSLWVANRAGNSVTQLTDSGAVVRILSAAKFDFRAPDAIAVTANDIDVINHHGSVTEINSTTGALVRVIRGARYGFDHPVAATAIAGRLWVVNHGTNTITELRTHNGAFVRVIGAPRDHFADLDAITSNGDKIWVVSGSGGSATDPHAGALSELDPATGAVVQRIHAAKDGLESPAGIADDGSNLWITDQATNSVTEVDVQGRFEKVITNSSHNRNYGFDAPTAAVYHGGNVYVISPPGSSPMVTKINADTSNGDWYECNTNSPDPEFVNPTGLTVVGGHVWVVSPNNNSLDELATSTGALIAHLT